jgi:PDZ domain-containing protein
MTLFQDGSAPNESPRRHSGLVLLTAAIVLGGLAMTVLPAPYVIERPGPAFNVLGSDQGKKVITVSDAETFATKGELDLLTVSLVGNREQTPSWPEIFAAWLDPAQTVTPMDEVYPIGTTLEESEAESVAMMEESQQSAIYVALTRLGYKIPQRIYAQQVNKNAPASGLIVAGDFIESVNGKKPANYDELVAMVHNYDGKTPLTFTVLRKSERKTFEIAPKKDKDGEYRIGVFIGTKFDFPVKVELELSDVGGPSGGMIFALGIYDALTQGALTGGAHIAGTGTIDPDGTVGPIGGIRQKLHAAQRAGAKYFLAPADNCNEVKGHIPAGLRVFRVDVFDDALRAVTAIGQKADLSKLETCASK